MNRWEYLGVKVYEFGSEEAELKRENEYWVSEYGLLPLLSRLGLEGWEASCQVGRDMILKRPVEGPLKSHAVAEVEEKERIRSGR